MDSMPRRRKAGLVLALILAIFGASATPVLAQTPTAKAPADAPAQPPAAVAGGEQPPAQDPAATPPTKGDTDPANDAGRNAEAGPSDRVQTPPDTVYEAMFKALFTVFVLAVVLESALAVIFNWRPFLMYFDGRGVRTLVMLAFAWSIVGLLKIDLVSQLHAATIGATTYERTVVGSFLTALVVAGGSAGVNNILRSLGFRDLGRTDEVVAKPPHDKAWLAVGLRRKEVRGPVRVFVQRGANPPELVGVIGRGSAPAAILRWFVRDPTRFPMSGGYAVPGGETYGLRVEGESPGAPLTVATWGPYPVAKGAIIDVELEL